MLPFLTACLANNLSGGGGGGPFTISAVNLTQNQTGTSCANPLKLNVSLVYTGSPSGATVLIEQSWDGGAYTTVASGVDPAATFPYLLSMLHDSLMTRPNVIVCPGGKMGLAMQLIFTPMILRLMDLKKRT